MSLILTYEQQQNIKTISTNNAHRYEQIAAEIEETDLKALLGTPLLQAIQDNLPEHSELLDGDTFEDCYGNTIKHKGLRYVLAYLNYAKYLSESSVQDTFSGFAVKQMEDSSPVNEGTILRLKRENQKIAMTEWELIKEYLTEKEYDLWYINKSKKPHMPKMTFLRKTLK